MPTLRLTERSYGASTEVQLLGNMSTLIMWKSPRLMQQDEIVHTLIANLYQGMPQRRPPTPKPLPNTSLVAKSHLGPSDQYRKATVPSAGS